MIRLDPHPALPEHGARILARVHWWLTACVLSFPVALYTFAAVVAVVLGRWPAYGLPEPQSLWLAFYYTLTWSTVVSVLASLLWLAFIPFFTFALGLRRVRWASVAFVLGVAVALIGIMRDPLGVWTSVWD